MESCFIHNLNGNIANDAKFGASDMLFCITRLERKS